MKTPAPRIPFVVYLPPPTYDDLQREALERRLSMNEVARQRLAKRADNASGDRIIIRQVQQ